MAMRDHTPKTLRSVRDIVDALGGTKEAAKWAGLGMSAISNWLAADEIPTGWHYRVDVELKARGYRVDPRLFGARV
jgi:hypothetical protein